MSVNSVKSILEKLDKNFELSEDDALDLYDELDTLYNELRSKYLTALAEPERNKEIIEKIFDVTKKLLLKNERNLEEELALIALLDILATDIHDRVVGLITVESEEEIKEESREEKIEEK
jgi:hypothetical protein